MALRAFPVLYAKDVESVAGFYTRLGFEEQFRLADETGAAGFIALKREAAELGVTTEASPRTLAGVDPGQGPRHELFVYVDNVDAVFTELRAGGAVALRDPADMPWGASRSSRIPKATWSRSRSRSLEHPRTASPGR